MLKRFLQFCPLLVLYILIILLMRPSGFVSDEPDYIGFATNLSQGYYSPLDDINLWFGPGYPIILLPFVLLKMPLLAARLLNALLLFGGALFVFRTLYQYMHERQAVLFTYLFGLHLPFFKDMPRLMTEILMVFLMCGALYSFTRLIRDQNLNCIYLIATAFFLAYGALTKVFFSYVILTCLLLVLGLYVWRRRDPLGRTLLALVLAFLMCIPYLVYTNTVRIKTPCNAH